MVRVIIERQCKPDNDGELHKLLIQMRGTAIKQHTYLSGEIHRNADDPSVWVTIVSWLTLDGWNEWKASPERQEIASKIESLLVSPERISVLEPIL